MVEDEDVTQTERAAVESLITTIKIVVRLAAWVILVIVAFTLFWMAASTGQSYQEWSADFADTVALWADGGLYQWLALVVGPLGELMVKHGLVLVAFLLVAGKILNPVKFSLEMLKMVSELGVSSKRFILGSEKWSECKPKFLKPTEYAAVFSLCFASTPGLEVDVPAPVPQRVEILQPMQYTDRVYFDEAGINPTQSELDSGVELSASAKQALSKTMDSLSQLAECHAKYEGEQREIEVTVRGFASDRGFRQLANEREVPRLNLGAANGRADQVGRYLQEQAQGSVPIKIEVEHWEDIQEMREERDSDEVGSGNDPVDQRIAWLGLSELEACEVLPDGEKPKREDL